MTFGWHGSSARGATDCSIGGRRPCESSSLDQRVGIAARRLRVSPEPRPARRGASMGLPRSRRACARWRCMKTAVRPGCRVPLPRDARDADARGRAVRVRAAGRLQGPLRARPAQAHGQPLADRAGAAPQAVVDAAEPGQPGVGRCRARPDQHIVEIKLPKAARFGDGMARARGAGGGAASGAARSQAAAVEVPRLRGPGAERRTATSGWRCTASCTMRRSTARPRWRWPTRSSTSTPEPRAIELQAEHAQRRRSASAWANRCAARWPHQIQQVSHIVKELPATVGTLGGAAGDGAARRAGQQQAVRRQGRLGNLALAPKTAFNASVTAGRAFAAVSLPLAELKVHRQGARSDDQRHGADGGVHRAAPLPRQEAHAAQEEPDRRGADLAAQAAATPRATTRPR